MAGGGSNTPGLAEVVGRFGKQLIQQHSLSARQVKALHNILQCRTARMGGHEQVCDQCGEVSYSYNSCGDRHCPKCQITKQAVWIDDLVAATLPVKHYHIIFTVPHQLNDICLYDSKAYYQVLFSAVWRTLHSFGYSHFGAETGAVAILHSWGQNLSLHPHIHCIVPAAGYTIDGRWKQIGKFKNFLYPVHQLSGTFKGKFLDSIRRKLKKMGKSDGFNEQLQSAENTRWVVYCEASMAKADHVMRYLGQYTHRIAISNHRIVSVTDTHVTFKAKDYRDGAQQKLVTMEGVEFLKRFCLHVMPHGFVRIRRYGIYNHTTQRNLDLQFFTQAQTAAKKIEKKKENPQERVKRLTGNDICRCPSCKSGRLIVVKELPRIRSPAGHLPSLLIATLQ